MSQSGFIAAMLLAAFVIWLAINDRLNVYAAILWGDTTQPKPQGNISNTNGVIAPAPSGGSGGINGLPELPGGVPSIPGLGGSGGMGSLLSNAGKIAGLLEFIP